MNENKPKLTVIDGETLMDIDEDTPVEDCTTKYYLAERKKNHGPVMGGM